MVSLIPFEAAHLAAFANRETGYSDDWRLAVGHLGPAFTVLDDSRIVACAGIATGLPPGLGVAWLSTGDGIAGHGLWLTRTVKRVIEDVMRTGHVRQVETLVLLDNPRHQRWAEVLGFQRDAAYVRYVRT